MKSRVLVAIVRSLANSCVIPPLRHALYRMSGLRIGTDTFINMGVTIVDDYKNLVSIGERVSIAPNVTIIASSGPNRSRLSQLKMFTKCEAVELRNDCWICAGAIILPGVIIGEKSIIAAGAVVRTSVGAGEIHGGVPNRQIALVEDYQ